MATKDSPKQDNFLADVGRPKRPRLGYVDGFRFGLGFFVAGLLLIVIIGSGAWLLVTFAHVR
jgi:hypothetical protein